MTTTDSTPVRPVARTAADLLARATNRQPLSNTDGKSAVPMQRVVIDETSYVTKQLSPALDWISRATGDYGCRARFCWQTGLLDELPDCLDHTTVAVAYEPDTLTTTLLMRDVAEHLVPEGNDTISLAQHRRFLDHMATLHATFWFRAELLPEVTPMTTRYTTLSPLTAEIEERRGNPPEVPAMLAARWRELDRATPDAARVARAIAREPWLLVDPLSETPSTFVHADWKLGNLGSQPDGRTILIDWQWPGTAPACVDLAWYLAVNSDRLPESKEDAIAAYRDALESHGIATASWFDRQLELCLLGGFVQLGWSKTHDDDELGWWAERACATAHGLF
ncbi:MAG: phosphotransferase [Actinomycetes bacterium]